MDELKHYGVKGMKWGVIRKKVQTAGRNYNRKRNAKAKASLEKYHEKNKDKKKYQQMYNYHSSRAKSHLTAVARTRRDLGSRDNNTNAQIAMVVAPLVIARGARLAVKAGRKMATPENVRRGKNIVQAIKRSPVRYVDGSKFKNVINP